MSVLRYALYCGAGAALASTAATMFSARAEGESPWRPLNATSHWLHGDAAGRRAEPDLAHTGLGAVTNVAAGMMWGGLFGAWLARRRSVSQAVVPGAAATGALAAGLDYGLLPRRLSPGWELALSPRSVGVSLAAMAAGMAAGGMAARAAEERARID